MIPVGLLLATAVAGTDDVPLRGGAGEVSFHPLAVREIRSPYRLAAGEMVVDLSRLDLDGGTVMIMASVAAGRLQVVVPADAAVEVDAHVGAGSVILLGREAGGIDVSRKVDDDGREGGGRIVLRTRAGLGEVEVRRAFA